MEFYTEMCNGPLMTAGEACCDPSVSPALVYLPVVGGNDPTKGLISESKSSSNVMCGVECFDITEVSQGMVFYNKIHYDVTLRSQAERRREVNSNTDMR